MADDDATRDGQDSELPTDCPECGTRLREREDVLVHVYRHVGEGVGA